MGGKDVLILSLPSMSVESVIKMVDGSICMKLFVILEKGKKNHCLLRWLPKATDVISAFLYF